MIFTLQFVKNHSIQTSENSPLLKLKSPNLSIKNLPSKMYFIPIDRYSALESEYT